MRERAATDIQRRRRFACQCSFKQRRGRMTITTESEGDRESMVVVPNQKRQAGSSRKNGNQSQRDLATQRSCTIEGQYHWPSMRRFTREDPCRRREGSCPSLRTSSY